MLKAIEQTSIPKEVLLRKKWLNAIHQHVLTKGDEQDLPDYLLGWRYELLTKPLIQLFKEESQPFILGLRIKKFSVKLNFKIQNNLSD